MMRAYQRAATCRIQHGSNRSTGWTPAARRSYASRMPTVDFSDDELRDAAQAARVAAVQAHETPKRN